MSASGLAYNVFISYSRRGPAITSLVTRAFADAGLRVFSGGGQIWANAGSAPGSNGLDSFREAVQECDAFVLLVPPAVDASAGSAIELGAAMSLGKPIFLLGDDSTDAPLPPYLRRFRRFPLSAVRELIGAVRAESEPWADEERNLLADLYACNGVPTDVLLSDVEAMEGLTEDFNRRASRPRPPERVFRELVKLRKSGRLPRLRRRRSVTTSGA